VDEIRDHINVKLKYNQLPKTIIIHGGGNDLADGKSPQQVAADMQELCSELRSNGVQNIAISGVTPRYLLKSEI